MIKNKELNDLYDYGLKIYQYSDSFKFSLDSILLAEFVRLNNRVKHILDLCTGNASIPLILSTKLGASNITSIAIDAVEIQKDIHELGKESIIYNNLTEQINLINADVKEHEKVLGQKKYDIITCNPPYFKVENPDLLNEGESLAISRHEIKITLEEIFNIASKHLNTKGEFYLIHRVERLDEIIIYGNKYHLPVKNIVLIKMKEENNPSLVLVRCIKGARNGIKITDKCIANLKTYQGLFKEVKSEISRGPR